MYNQLNLINYTACTPRIVITSLRIKNQSAVYGCCPPISINLLLYCVAVFVCLCSLMSRRFEKIKNATGITDIDQLVSKFIEGT